MIGKIIKDYVEIKGSIEIMKYEIIEHEELCNGTVRSVLKLLN